MRLLVLYSIAAALLAAPPSITELQPRGAQKGRPFVLTIVGDNLGQGAAVVSTLPASFTPLGAEKPGMADRYATFLVEPTAEWNVGVYPIRVKGPNGISNILLFSIGAFPEIFEEESRPGALPNQNDSIENAQPLPTTPVTLNGTLRGPERDFYRVQVKAGERRVFEVDARRCGSAIDPVIRVLDASGKLIARSEDDPLLSLDPRLDITFEKAGYYYVELHDARFSTQAQNYYRLKTGAYEYASGVYPLGGPRGERVDVDLGGSKVKVDLASIGSAPQVFVNLPESPALPLPFAVGELPEVHEPVSGPLHAPVTVNGRLSKPEEIDRYEMAVQPGEEFIFELQARELGTSKLTGLITVYDENGNRLASAGDGPIPLDVGAVQVSSRTLGDPFLQFQVPDGVRRIAITVEDLAQRGGPVYAYRLSVVRASIDLRATIAAPFLNIPAGGTAVVGVTVERRGYLGPIRVEAVGLPPGAKVDGGDIPMEVPDPNNRANSRRAILSITAPPEMELSSEEIGFRVIAVEAEGGEIERPAKGIGYSINVAGATEQGVVDRQRPLTGGWLGLQLPVAMTDPAPAALSLALEHTERKEAGYEFRFRWNWELRDPMQPLPETVQVDLPNFTDLRVIEMAAEKGNRRTGTFVVTSTLNTLPALYNIGVSGRLRSGGSEHVVSAPILSFTLPAHTSGESNVNASSAAAR
ncbi:MAG: hypothetical protein ACK5AZ_18275 [Bryobacteraceae bacterium]